jgi:hypothetical protein
MRFAMHRTFGASNTEACVGILDPKFRYTDSYSTDVRKTFARFRRAQQAAVSAKSEKTPKVLHLEQARKANASKP